VLEPFQIDVWRMRLGGGRRQEQGFVESSPVPIQLLQDIDQTLSRSFPGEIVTWEMPFQRDSGNKECAANDPADAGDVRVRAQVVRIHQKKINAALEALAPSFRHLTHEGIPPEGAFDLRGVELFQIQSSPSSLKLGEMLPVDRPPAKIGSDPDTRHEGKEQRQRHEEKPPP